MECHLFMRLHTILALGFEHSGDKHLFKCKEGYRAEFLSVFLFQCSDMTEILLKNI